jgi:hypothetical protein
MSKCFRYSKVPILVHEEEKEIRKTLEQWSEGESFNRTLFGELMRDKKIIPDIDGVDMSTVKQFYGTKGSEIKKLQKRFSPFNMYVNRGTKE